MSDKNKKEVICFLGMKNCGKDYNAKTYLEYGFKKIAFADPLRDICYTTLGYRPENEKDYSFFKKASLNLKSILFKFAFLTISRDEKCGTGRTLLQNLGSVMKKYFGDDIWAKLWYNQVLEYDGNVVATDCRFPCEIKKAMSLEKKGYNVSFIWVCYPGADFINILEDKHVSEALAQYMYYNQNVYNLKDLTRIDNKTIKKILKDFERYTKGL